MDVRKDYQMDQEKDAVNAALTIYDYDGKLDLQELTRQIGLEPDEVVKKGQSRRPGGPPLSNGLWSVKSDLPASAPPEEHIVRILERVRPYKQNIKRVAEQYKTVLSIGATYYDFNPEIVLEPMVSKELAELGAQLWFDIYCFTRTHLETELQKRAFAKAIAGLDVVRHASGGEHSEAEALTRALSIIEKSSADITDWLVPDLMGQKSTADSIGNLNVLINKLQDIQTALAESRILSQQLRVG